MKQDNYPWAVSINIRKVLSPHQISEVWKAVCLHKYHNIGEFWEKPKKEIWQAVIDKEKRIAEGLEKPNIRKLV